MKEPYLNCLIKWTGSEVCERLLCWHVPGQSYFAIATEGSRAWPFVRGKADLDKALRTAKALVLDEDHLVRALRRDELLTDVQRQHQRHAWAVIKDLVEDEQHHIMNRVHSGRLIRATAEKYSVHLTSVYKYLRRYWQRGQLESALQPDFARCGGPGKERVPGERKLGDVNANGSHSGINVTDTVKAAFRDALERYYLTERQLPLTKVYLKLLNDHFIVGYEVVNGATTPKLAPEEQRPTFAQFRYFYDKNYRKMETLRRRIGVRRFEQNFREVTRDQTKTALGIGDIYQIDATTADVYLVLSSNPNIVVGRPIVYLVVDVFSQLVVGVHVTFDTMKYDAAALAIWTAFTDKVEFCSRFGITGLAPEHWPACGLPQSLLADRGEMLATKSDVLVKHLNIKVSNAPAYCPTTKALVERHFKLRNDELIRWLDGAVPASNDDKAGKENYRKRSSLTPEDFTEALLRSILAYNLCIREDYQLTEAMIRDGVEPRPYKIWAWGLKHANYLRNMDPLQVRLGLLPAEEGLVTRHGISFRGLMYTCERAQLEEWFSQARAGTNNWRVTCSYDPNCVGRLFLPGESMGKYDVCSLTVKYEQFQAWSWAEYESYRRAQNKAILAGKKDDLVVLASAQAQIDAIAKRAEDRRKAAGPAKVDLLQAAQLEQKQMEARQAAEELAELLKSKPKTVAESVVPVSTSKVASAWVSACEEDL